MAVLRFGDRRGLTRLRALTLILYALIGTVLVMVFWPISGPPPRSYQRMLPWNSVADDYRYTGLWPPTTEEFFSSCLGKTATSLRHEDPEHHNFGGLGITSRRTGDSMVITVSFANVTPLVETLRCSEQEQTILLLRSLVRGTRWWRKSVLRWQNLCNRAFRGSSKLGVPPISFNRPTNSRELAEYQRWLSRVVGSSRRLRDGWGRPIRLSLHDWEGQRSLVASSAGKDGKWDNSDDFAVVSNLSTGAIVHETKGKTR